MNDKPTQTLFSAFSFFFIFKPKAFLKSAGLSGSNGVLIFSGIKDKASLPVQTGGLRLERFYFRNDL